MTKDEVVGNALGIAGLVLLPIIMGVTIYLDRKAELGGEVMRGRGFGQARQNEERGKGIPRENIERAMRHYGITPEQYLTCPDCYPLPDRGAGLYG